MSHQISPRPHRETDAIGVSFVGGFVTFLIGEALELHHPVVAFAVGAAVTFLIITILLVRDENRK